MPEHTTPADTLLYFGSFNPVHKGHIAIAEAAMARHAAQEIWFVLSPQNPFKASSGLWPESEREKRGLFGFTPKADIQHITAEQLIREIDRSFKAWKENAYTCHDSFEDFCCYILPYRFSELPEKFLPFLFEERPWKRLLLFLPDVPFVRL